MAKILIIDDEVLLRTLVEKVGRRLGYEVMQATTIAQGLQYGALGVDVVLLDKMLPDGDGLAHMQEILQLPGKPHVLVITGHGDGDVAEHAFRSGAWEFLCKPLQVKELSNILQQIMAHRRQAKERISSAYSHSRQEKSCPHIIGNSPVLQKTLQRLCEVAKSSVNVLLLGETGVGKELFARTLYENSLRAKQAFVTVDCAALPENLVESHLFGHTKGAFTGADKAKDGLLLRANNGTLFLDEVGSSAFLRKSFFCAP